MRDEDKTEEQLVDELAELQQRIAESEASEAERVAEPRSNEERLKAKYKGIPVPTYTWQKVEEDFVLVDYNDAAVAITQGNVAKFLGAKASEMYRDTPKIREELSRSFAEKTSIEREMPYQFEVTGESRYLAVKYVFVPPDLVLAHTEDITERKQAEEALRELKRKYRDLVENVGEVIYAIDGNGLITYISPAVIRFIGYKPSEVIGRSFTEFVYKEDLSRIMEGFRKIISGHLQPSEYRFIAKSGEIRWARTASRPTFEADRITGIQGVVTDITERKRATEALRESEKKLRDIADRWMAEKKLMRSEKLALLGRLSTNLVNELSNPIDGALRYIRLLLDQMPEDDPGRIYAEYARDGLMRIANMVEGLLDFARKSAQILSPIDIPRSIRRVFSSFGDRILAQNIKVETEFDENIPVIMNADVEQIFVNIIKNAIQAMPSGGTLSVKAKMLSPQLFEATFTDTGPGIPDEIQGNIFDPFFTTKDIGQAVGLGLSVSQGIAESYGGSIDVESESHKGTTFAVRLPISKGGLTGCHLSTANEPGEHQTEHLTAPQPSSEEDQMATSSPTVERS